jgi:hypothetical protein
MSISFDEDTQTDYPVDTLALVPTPGTEFRMMTDWRSDLLGGRSWENPQ